jgi:hypothetical protein
MARPKGSTNKPKPEPVADQVGDTPVHPDGGSNTESGITISTRFHEPMGKYVWDVSYTLDGRAYTDPSFQTGAEAEAHAAMIRESYGDRVK